MPADAMKHEACYSGDAQTRPDDAFAKEATRSSADEALGDEAPGDESARAAQDVAPAIGRSPESIPAPAMYAGAAPQQAAPTSAPAVRPAIRASWSTKSLLALAIVFALHSAQALLLPLVIAVILACVLSTPVRLLRRHGVPETIGAGVLVLTLIGVTVLMGTALAGPAAQWWERAPTTLAQVIHQIDRLRAAIPLLAPPPPPPPPRAPARGAQPAPPSDPVKDKLASEGVALTRALAGHTLSFAISTAAMVILLYFLLASEHWLLSRTVEAVPRPRTRALLLAGVRSAERDIGRYLGMVGMINLVVGTITGAAMYALDLPNPVLWGSIAAVLNFIPYIGPLMMSVLLLLAGVLTFFDAASMLAPPAAFLLIHAIESNVATPLLVGRRLSLSPLTVFLSVMFWGWLWGIAGALIAVPMLIALRSLCKRNRRLRLICCYLEGDYGNVPSLRSLLRSRRRSPVPHR